MLTTRALARQGTVVFDIDGEKWTLDLRPGQRKVTQGAPEGKPDLTLTISDDNFVKLVSGKMGPQQARSELRFKVFKPWYVIRRARSRRAQTLDPALAQGTAVPSRSSTLIWASQLHDVHTALNLNCVQTFKSDFGLWTSSRDVFTLLCPFPPKGQSPRQRAASPHAHFPGTVTGPQFSQGGGGGAAFSSWTTLDH